MFGTIPREVYNEAYRLLTEDSRLAYIQTKQRAFYPRGENLVTPNLYPWVFIEFIGISSVEVFRMPANFDYELSLGIVVMAFADEGKVDDTVFRDSDDPNANRSKGAMDIISDLGIVFWGGKQTHFNVSGVVDFTITRVGTPSVLSVQTLLMNPFVRGLQMDMAFHIQERS